MRAERAGLTCVLAAVAGCQFAGLQLPDLSKSAKKEVPAEEEPVSREGGEAARAPAADEAPTETAAPVIQQVGRQVGQRTGEREAPPVAAAPALKQVREPAISDGAARAARAAPGPETPGARRSERVRAEVAESAEPPAPSEAEAAPVGKETEAAAAGEPAETRPAAEEEAPVAEPPKGSNFWFYFLVVLAMAVVGAAAWFFLQPPWKRGRWWRLLKAYVRDWRTGGFEETPPRGSPSLGMFSAAKPGREKGPLGVVKRAPKQEFGAETSLHLEDLSEDDAAGPVGDEKSSRYGQPLKPRDTAGVGQEDVAREVAAAGGAGGGSAEKSTKDTTRGGKSGKASKKTGRKRTTNITLPVISKGSKKRKKS